MSTGSTPDSAGERYSPAERLAIALGTASPDLGSEAGEDADEPGVNLPGADPHTRHSS